MATSRRVAAPLYLVGVALLLIPPFDGIMQMAPFRMHDPRWRFGFFAIMSNSMLLACVGLWILCVTASWRGHRGVQRLLGAFSVVGALYFIISAGMFTLDVFQLRAEVPAQAALPFKVAALVAGLKAVLAIITLGALSRATLSTPNVPQFSTRERSTASLVIGQGGRGSVSAPATVE